MSAPKYTAAAFFKTDDLVAQLRALASRGAIYTPAAVCDELAAAAADELQRLQTTATS